MAARRIILAVLLAFLSIASVSAVEFKAEAPNPSYHHDKWGTLPRDQMFEFRAYITSFDGDDDDDGDGVADMRGIPEWVSYEIRRYKGKLPVGPARPTKWITDQQLYDAHIAPGDETYEYSLAFRRKHPNWYVRGHLCMKQHAWRLGAGADWNTHTVLNAVPQRDDFNSGIWQNLENLTAKWADKYGAVWIIDGPIFDGRRPSAWLGEKGEMKIAIPDALFKIVIKESGKHNRPDVLAFVYPQTGSKYRKGPFDHTTFLTSVHHVEELTGLTFLTDLSSADQDAIKDLVPEELWK